MFASSNVCAMAPMHCMMAAPTKIAATQISRKPPMSQARKSFGAELAKLQRAVASGGADDEHEFLRGIATLGKDLSCCLCLSTFERPVRTSCKHYYCAECLNESLRRKQQCPLCKEKVTRRDVQDDEFVAALVWKYRRIVTAANA